jgi:hypothetical protein
MYISNKVYTQKKQKKDIPCPHLYANVRFACPVDDLEGEVLDIGLNFGIHVHCDLILCSIANQALVVRE